MPLYPQKLALNFANKWWLLSIVRLRTKGHGVCLFCYEQTFCNLYSALALRVKNQTGLKDKVGCTMQSSPDSD
jgi:hypothetical protein